MTRPPLRAFAHVRSNFCVQDKTEAMRALRRMASVETAFRRRCRFKGEIQQALGWFLCLAAPIGLFLLRRRPNQASALPYLDLSSEVQVCEVDRFCVSVAV